MRFIRYEHGIWRVDKECVLNVSLGKYPLGRSTRRWEANIKMECIVDFDVN
jgi:hypothetical protein